MVPQEPLTPPARPRMRPTARLREDLDKHLLAYATAANAANVGRADQARFHCGAAVTAAGLGMAALASPAEAKIVYTPANVQITKTFHLDLNRDGINDFAFYFFGSVHLTSATGSFLSVLEMTVPTSSRSGKKTSNVSMPASMSFEMTVGVSS